MMVLGGKNERGNKRVRRRRDGCGSSSNINARESNSLTPSFYICRGGYSRCGGRDNLSKLILKLGVCYLSVNHAHWRPTYSNTFLLMSLWGVKEWENKRAAGIVVGRAAGGGQEREPSRRGAGQSVRQPVCYSVRSDRLSARLRYDPTPFIALTNFCKRLIR